MSEDTLAYYPVIKIDGTNLAVEKMDLLLDLEVNTTLGVPSMFVMRFSDDDELSLSDGSDFGLGKEVEIQMPDDGSPVTVIKGEITAIEPDFSEGMTVILTIRGYDKSHRLNRETKTKSFVDVTDSDVVNTIAGAAGFSVTKDSTTTVHPVIIQDNQTDLAFIHMLAHRNGFEVFVEDSTLYFRKHKGTLGEISLEWGNELISFRPRISGAKQVDEVTVKGWDPTNKTAIVGQVTSPTSTDYQGGVSDSGGSAATSAFAGAAKHMAVHYHVEDQTEAQDIAQGILDRISAGYVRAEGVAYGNAELVAGKKINLTSLGEKYNGSYRVTSATHIYSSGEGYRTHFTIGGERHPLMADLLGASSGSNSQSDNYWGGVVSAIVTNNNNGDRDWGEVKVRFPWMPDVDGAELESGWARIATIGAGLERGIYWMPEIEDEVLVAFDHGNFNHPYIIGSLWNGTDTPSAALSEVVADGKVDVRLFKTRAGHIIRLTDTEGSEKIEIIDSDEKTSLTIDTANEEFNVATSGKVIITADGDIELTASGDLNLKGANVNIESTSSNVSITAASAANIEATGNAKLEGSGVTVKSTASSATLEGTGGATVKSAAITEIKGSLVKIN